MSGIGGVGGTRYTGPVDDTAPAADTAATSATSGTSAPVRTTTAAPVARATPAAAPSATTALNRVAVGTLPDGKQIAFNPATGRFSSKTTGGSTTTGNLSMYRAAQLVSENNVAFLTNPALGASGRLKLATTLEEGLKAGNGATGVPKLSDQQARSGAATISLAMAKGLPDGDPVKGRLVQAYVDQMGKEGLKGLRASMFLNLDEACKKGEIRLTPAQRAELGKAGEATLPSKPPYDEWFKNGKTDLNVKQYIHPEFYDAMLNGYKQQGFRTTQDLGDGHLKMQREYTDAATGKKTKVNVEVIKTFAEGHKPELRLFNDMSDKNTDIEFYTGHSNLGGNVLGALQAGPKEQDGAKWVIDWMCRGKQVLADVYNRFPNAHYTTTTDPAYVIHSGKFLGGMFQGIAERKGYDDMWNKMGDTRIGFGHRSQEQLKDWFMKPNDPRIIEVRDIDKDGKVDLSKLSGTDKLYNVGQRSTTENAQRFRPETIATNPQDLPGDKVMRGVNFLNTILTYHQDEADHPGGNDGRLPKGVGDQIAAGGWYKSSGDEIVKVEKKTVAGKQVFEVKVNSKYANQDVDTLGAAISYEVNKALSIEKNGSYSEQDKLRGVLLAGEYCAYMGQTYEEVSGITKGMQAKYGFNNKLTWENINKALEADNLGYVSPDATRELKRLIGSADPRIG